MDVRNKRVKPVPAGEKLEKHAVRIFGCEKCSLLIFHHPDTDAVTCPYCNVKIDVYAQYRNVAFAEGIQIRVNENDVARLLEKLDA